MTGGFKDLSESVGGKRLLGTINHRISHQRYRGCATPHRGSRLRPAGDRDIGGRGFGDASTIEWQQLPVAARAVARSAMSPATAGAPLLVEAQVKKEIDQRRMWMTNVI